MSDSTRTCTKCKSVLPATLEYFPPRKSSPDGLYAQCRTCYSAYKSAYHYANHERELKKSRERYAKRLPQDIETTKKWREANRDKLLEDMRQYHSDHREEANKRRREHYYENREENLKQQKQDRIDNPEKYRAYRKTDYRNNLPRIQRYIKRYRQKNKERIRNTIKEWKKKNPLRIKMYEHNRVARLRDIDGTFTDQDLEQIYDKQDGKCYYCGCEDCKLTIDHKTPISRDGTNYPSNLCWACVSCNSSKSDKTEAEFWEYLRRLGG